MGKKEALVEVEKQLQEAYTVAAIGIGAMLIVIGLAYNGIISKGWMWFTFILVFIFGAGNGKRIAQLRIKKAELMPSKKRTK